ncbi:Dephospho-CoA kinase (EC [Olavius sp. associated proteobacterium Delta 1]|nr:Dephospho-CoA kinase (EC [Olavius sp. associated proteobacterium Delta 1]
MNTSRDWEKPIRRLELLMRLKSFPVAFKLFEDRQEISKIPFIRRMNHKSTLCQLINMVRNFDWTVGAELDDFMSVVCPSIIGLTDIPDYMKDGTFRSIVWTKSRADAKKYEAEIPRLPSGKYTAVAMAPLVYNPFDPDIVLIYANPAQMMLLINSLQFENYEVMQFYCVGESSCSDAIARCYLKANPALSIPCYGERRYGHAQDDEMVMAIPAEMMDKALNGMEALYKRGIRYPISYAGAESDVAHAFPAAYGAEDMINKLRGNDNRLLLGVTGSIATGKTTVAGMLEELGVRTIDFDVLSRVVVEPDKPAWQDIVAFFGEQILAEDRSLDRTKLREIVFQDLEKKKKLESFQHPRIFEEFIKQVEQYAGEDPNVIIQAVVPLLIEVNMQSLFHNILMVYASEDEQKKRLMKRDGASEEMAMNMIRSQVSVDEKKGYCDLVIDNSGSPEQTRKQVEKLWQKLKKIQRERKGSVE